MKKINVYFVRHGQTYYNLMSKMQGWSDAPLTEKGIKDLALTAKGLANTHFDAFYSSDLKRAMDTAQMIIDANTASDPKPPLLLNKNFREVGFGIFEGIYDGDVAKILGKPLGMTTFEEIGNKYGIDGIRDLTKEADTSGLAEGSGDVYARMADGFNDLLQENNDGDSILVVSHGGYIRMIAEKYESPEQKEKFVPLPSNGSVTTLEISEDGVKVIDFAKPNTEL